LITILKSGVTIRINEIKYGYWKDQYAESMTPWIKPEIIGKQYLLKFKDGDYLLLSESEGSEFIERYSRDADADLQAMFEPFRA
jgi:hypothetical protein